MPGSPVKIGPFVGGLNNVSQAGESKDNEVVELVNFELALDTSLVSRPPIEVVPSTPSNLANQWDVLGIYRITASNWYVIVNQPTGATTYNVNAYALGDFSGVPTLIKTTTGLNNRVVSFAQYNDWCYFNVATGATDTGFRWKTGSAVAAIATMPRGTVMVSWKDRLWITGSNQGTDGNYLWFSTVDGTGPHPETWNTAVDFINVDPGFGGLNSALLPLISSLLIFKSDATYRFSFPAAPKNGEVSKASSQIGAASPTSVIGFESYAYVYDQGRVYELINNKFTQINLNVNFNSDSDAPDATAPGVDMSVVNRRLIIRYFNTLYTYHVDTRTWSQWKTNGGTPGYFMELPADSSSALPSTFIAASRGTTQLTGVNKIFNPGFTDAETNNKRLVSPNSNGSATIGNGIVVINKTGAGFPEFFLSKNGVLDDYDIPVSPNQKFTFTASVSSTYSGTNKMEVHYNFLLRSGATSTTTVNILAADVPNLSDEITIPANALLMNVSIKISAATPVGNAITLSNPVIVRSTTASPVSILRLVDQYQNTTAMEYIECYVKTKAYDYQANSVFKRLFLWGLDVKTNRPIEMQAIPLGRKQSVTWDDLEPYTWDQLEAGTWDNPLSWLGVSNTVIDMTDEISDVSENGRFFVKALKSLRFRQIQYAIKMTTLGNSETGPAKLFSLTTYTKASQMVVDKAT
jgi:hypothetical protein